MRAATALAALALVLVSCTGSSGGEAAPESTRAQPTTASTLTSTAAPEGPRIDLAELRRAPRIVFVRGDAGRRGTASGDLYIARADGTGVRLVRRWKNWKTRWNGETSVLEGVAPVAARWSPDRRSIALAQYGWLNDPYLWAAIVSTDGRRERILMKPGFGPYTAPSWSPDGSRLVLGTIRQLRVVDLRDGSSRELPIEVRRVKWIDEPDWSPNGAEIAFSVRGRGIAVTSSKGGEVRFLTDRGIDLAPAWSPDGSLVAFARKGIWVVGADGSGLRQLTEGGDDNPRWSPDGTMILFRRSLRRDDFVRRQRRPLPSWELYVMDADGGRETRLPFNLSPTDPDLGEGIISADWGR